jgi:hypothetical protein
VFSDTIESKCRRINDFCIGAGRNYLRTFSWININTIGLTKDHLKTLYRIKGFKDIPDITQIDNHIVIQYKDKAPIIIDTSSGQILIPKNYSIEDVKNQLEKVIRILQLDERVKEIHINTRKVN